MNGELSRLASEAMDRLFAQKEETIKASLRELVSRGLIALEETPLRLETAAGEVVNIVQSARLVPREFEYIKDLESLLVESRKFSTHLGACAIKQTGNCVCGYLDHEAKIKMILD